MQWHAIVPDTTSTTYTRQQTRYIEKEELERKSKEETWCSSVRYLCPSLIILF